ncbi:putative bifunctional inhibitor/plant lipid transfer protein/seed storage helical [Dioscorea sansibarensis]
MEVDDSGGTLLYLIIRCEWYMRRSPRPISDPSSDDCCDAVQKTDVSCICSQVTPEVEEVISMQKVTHVAQKCGRPFSPGTMSGSYAVPPKIHMSMDGDRDQRSWVSDN